MLAIFSVCVPLAFAAEYVNAMLSRFLARSFNVQLRFRLLASQVDLTNGGKKINKI